MHARIQDHPRSPIQSRAPNKSPAPRELFLRNARVSAARARDNLPCCLSEKLSTDLCRGSGAGNVKSCCREGALPPERLWRTAVLLNRKCHKRGHSALPGPANFRDKCHFFLGAGALSDNGSKKWAIERLYQWSTGIPPGTAAISGFR